MASVGFGSSVAAVAPASLAGRGGRGRRFAVVVPAATRSGGGQAAAKEEKGLVDFIFSAIFKKDQLLETDPLLNKADGAPSSGSTVSRKASGTDAGGKKPAGGGGGDGGGFNFGGIAGMFAKKG